ncbi:V-type proton ATPase [Actinidia chinensis var. chinensis]|uniref:V-type proton ATPase subunit G n=1 Tax=Actinidia chinensis var. chinensis TaxID=1590841 RepID=A0A2R6R7X6_ACTCC|nr:V-type proton ATPase [Actinidia chinensis var. chinensis]
METNRHQRQKGGIQLLLAAEQESKQIVNAAKSAKLARLKQAKEELETEVAEYRAQMELEFQQKVTESNRDSGANAKRLEQETGEKIDRLKMEAGKILQDVNLILLKDVITVKV